MAHPGETAAMIIISIVAVIALFLTVTAWRSAHRTGNRRLLLVTGAFGALGIKGLLVAYSLQTEMIGHETLEWVSSLFDLVVVILLALPLLR